MIRTAVIFLALLLFGLFIQATFIHGLFPSAPAPDFLLILVVMLGLNYKSPGGALGAFILGILADFASARFVGPNAAGAVLAFYFVVVISGHTFVDRGAIGGLVAFVACCVKSISFLLMRWIYVGVSPAMTDVTALLIEAVLTGVLAPFVLHLLSQRTRSSTLGRRLEGEMYR